MERKPLIEPKKQEDSEKAVQTVKNPVEKKPRRSIETKIGRQKYHEVLTKRMSAKIDKLEASMRVILNGLKGAGYFRFTVPLLQQFACQDQVDVEIIECVKEVGNTGIFPKDVAASLQQYELAYYDVSRRIVRMNKRLRLETGELLFEKRGHKWALTRFVFEIINESEQIK